MTGLDHSRRCSGVSMFCAFVRREQLLLGLGRSQAGLAADGDSIYIYGGLGAKGPIPISTYICIYPILISIYTSIHPSIYLSIPH